MDVCTIIAKNYVAQARVLARSFAEHHPDGRFWTLIIDDHEGYIEPAEEPFEVLTPAEIGCEEFAEMSFRYGVLELSTAVKPWLLRHLMTQTGAPVTYLDPDIRIFGSLRHLDELAAAHGVVLIPHNDAPIPADGRRPSQIDIMKTGVYNLGYVSLAPRADVERLLEWWAERLRRDCRIALADGYFVDQRWFDLTPGFLTDFAIVRDPEYNVAYWNLHSRTLEHDGERYLVDGRPLAFFHFSGFDPEQPEELSIFQDRLRLADHPVLERLCREYADAVQGEGLAAARRWPYTYGTMPGGVPYDDVVRGFYLIAEESGQVHGSPLAPDSGQAFVDWLAAQQPGSPPGINRLLAYIYGSRADLHQRFPDVGGADLPRLLEWARGEGAEEVPALGHLPPLPVTESDAAVPDAASTSAGARTPVARRPPPSELWGVNVVGYFRSELGVGEAARQVIGALDAVGVPVLPLHGESIPLSRQGHPYTQLDHTDAEYPVNLICMNADELPKFAAQAGEWFFAGRYSIGLWFWEVSRFRPEFFPAFESLDEVWLPSAHVAEAVGAVSPIPTRTIRLPVEMPPIPARSREALGVPEDFLFLFSFDYRSVFARKNPLAVVRAFTRAFDPGEGASLVIKCINGEADPGNHARLLAAAAEHPDIRVIDRYFSPEDKNALTAGCDAFVSLHRSEGFGYTMAEAMYCAKPVIATGYSGNLEFMTPENSLLVEHRLVRIGHDAAPYPADGEWAEPDESQAAGHMRRLFEDRDLAAALGRRAAADIRRTHSAAAAGALMGRRLEQLRANSTLWYERPGATLIEPSLRDRVARGPSAFAPPGRRRARRLVRRGLLRVLRPVTAYQEAVNAELVGSLQTLSDELERVRARQARATAALLAAQRRQASPSATPSASTPAGAGYPARHLDSDP